MGQIVFAAGASHSPLITAFWEKADPVQAKNFQEGFAAMQEKMRAARPEAIIVISNDHFHNFFYNNMPAFCLGVGESCPGPVEPWLKIPHTTVRLHQPLARALLEGGLQAGMDFASSEELVLDHAMMVPLHFLTPQMEIPIVPLFLNSIAPPMPTLPRCYHLGEVLAKVVRDTQAVRRVALLGTGGLSHWVGTPEMGQISPDFDKELLALLAEGRGEKILDYTDAQISAVGNGTHEIRNWLPSVGAASGRPWEVFAYEPVPAWVTGCALAAARLNT